MNCDNAIELPRTYTKMDIPVTHNQIPKPEMLKQLPHLRGLAKKLPEYNPHLEIGLLIGSNCPLAMQPIEVVPAENDGPFAVLYRLGWTINGPHRLIVNSTGEVTCNRVVLQEVEIFRESVIAKDISRMMTLDFSEHDVGKIPGESSYSQEDKQFIKIAQEGIKFTEGHYELPLPLRDMKTPLQNNRQQALKRALWQKKKMSNNNDYHLDYRNFMAKIIDKGYAYKVPQEELGTSNRDVRYLPHHGVYHPQKRKIRVVFDCSAKYGGMSLNDALLPGPDLTNSLVGVVTRFREEPIAFLGDIESMFYQVRVPYSQHDYLRFLWWPDGDLDAEIEEYRMAVHIFGAASSPSITNFALKRTAEKARTNYSISVADTICNNFYVDDCLKAMEDEDSAIKHLGDLISACKDGGFRLTKFNSNSTKVMKTVPNEELACGTKTVDFDKDSTGAERVLGIQWHIEKDSWRFSFKLEDKSFTRRCILSSVASVYDPMGFIAPFVLPAKKLLQELCEENIEWDEEISDALRERWIRWLNEVPLIEQLNIKRCLKPANFGKVVSSQIHVFSDASTLGYGSVAYIRLVNDEGDIHTSFLIGKSRLAPIKTTTIPRLELTAATVSVRLGCLMLKELSMKIDNIFYHTDSTTVLHYINNSKKRFPVFVANRVQLIHDFTEPSQWRFVNTESNPADIASRGHSAHELLSNSTWLNGPAFLQKRQTEWPAQPVYLRDRDETDLTLSFTTVCQDAANETISSLINHFSSWLHLRKVVAIYRKFFEFLGLSQDKNKRCASKISVHDLEEAEFAVVRFVQQSFFQKEMDSLQNNLHAGVIQSRDHNKAKISRSSSIYRLDPFLDSKNGVLRVGGRLRCINAPDEMKHPLLMPYKHHVTTLIIRQIHECSGHVGRNHVLSELRLKYWVLHSNSAVRGVLSKCVTCRKKRAPVMEQKMADLPIERVIPAPPFTHTGVDYFGPFIVKEKRKEMKRYGVLFTCLSSRSIHIESSNSLDTGSFVQALRRFIARRGQVRVIRSDNGTNFKGAERELREAVKEMNQNRIHTR